MKMISRAVAQTFCLWGRRASCLPLLSRRRNARSPHRLVAASRSGGGLEARAIIALVLVLGFTTANSHAQHEPILVPDVVRLCKITSPFARPGAGVERGQAGRINRRCGRI